MKIPKRYEHCTLENYKADSLEKQEVLQAVAGYGCNFSALRKNGAAITLRGTGGTGKTHLAVGLAKRIENKYGLSSAFLSMDTLLGGYHLEDLYSLLDKTDFFVLDDLQLYANFPEQSLRAHNTLSILYNLKMPFVLTSIATTAVFEKYIGQSCVERLKEGGGKILNLQWASYRTRACQN